VEKTW